MIIKFTQTLRINKMGAMYALSEIIPKPPLHTEILTLKI
jgi:hypothetical protein